MADYLGIRKVLWLPRGIYLDETNEHVDNVCAFTAPGEVVLAWTDNKADPQYPLSKACLDYLNGVTDAAGRKLKVRLLPIPDHPILCTEPTAPPTILPPARTCASRRPSGRELRKLLHCQQRGAGAAVWRRERRQRCTCIGDPARSLPHPACHWYRRARNLAWAGGNIHCITQQVPATDKHGGMSAL